MSALPVILPVFIIIFQLLLDYFKQNIKKNGTFQHSIIEWLSAKLYAHQMSASAVKPMVCFFGWNFTETHILWSLCLVHFHTLTLQLPIRTPHSVTPEFTWKLSKFPQNEHTPALANIDSYLFNHANCHGKIQMMKLTMCWILDWVSNETNEDVHMYTCRIYSSRYLDTLLHKVEGRSWTEYALEEC